MRARLLVFSGFLAILGFSCAEGSALTGGEGGDDNNASSSSSSASSSAMSGSSSSSTGTGCSEDPCKITLPQCGCDTGQQCSLGGSGERTCVDEGTLTQGAACGSLAGECLPGLLCIG